MEKGNVSPGDGGCWFCYSDGGTMRFSGEFDTFVHESCLKEEFSKHPDNPEASIMFIEIFEPKCSACGGHIDSCGSSVNKEGKFLCFNCDGTVDFLKDIT